MFLPSNKLDNVWIGVQHYVPTIAMRQVKKMVEIYHHLEEDISLVMLLVENKLTYRQ